MRRPFYGEQSSPILGSPGGMLGEEVSAETFFRIVAIGQEDIQDNSTQHRRVKRISYIIKS